MLKVQINNRSRFTMYFFTPLSKISFFSEKGGNSPKSAKKKLNHVWLGSNFQDKLWSINDQDLRCIFSHPSVETLGKRWGETFPTSHFQDELIVINSWESRWKFFSSQGQGWSWKFGQPLSKISHHLQKGGNPLPKSAKKTQLCQSLLKLSEKAQTNISSRLKVKFFPDP